jgi:hypothetical protein
MQDHDKNTVEAVPTELQVEQSEFMGSPSPYRNSLSKTLLFLSGLGLWGSAAIGAGALLFGGKGDAAITQLYDLFMIAGPAAWCFWRSTSSSSSRGAPVEDLSRLSCRFLLHCLYCSSWLLSNSTPAGSATPFTTRAGFRRKPPLTRRRSDLCWIMVVYGNSAFNLSLWCLIPPRISGFGRGRVKTRPITQTESTC